MVIETTQGGTEKDAQIDSMGLVDSLRMRSCLKMAVLTSMKPKHSPTTVPGVQTFCGLPPMHEFGHVLGLDHSSDRDAIMFPYYPDFYHPNLNLEPDDIAGIQSLYGKNSSNVARGLGTAKLNS